MYVYACVLDKQNQYFFKTLHSLHVQKSNNNFVLSTLKVDPTDASFEPSWSVDKIVCPRSRMGNVFWKIFGLNTEVQKSFLIRPGTCQIFGRSPSTDFWASKMWEMRWSSSFFWNTFRINKKKNRKAIYIKYYTVRHLYGPERHF